MSDDVVKTIEQNMQSFDLFEAAARDPDITNDPDFLIGFSGPNGDVKPSSSDVGDWLHANTLYYWPRNGDILFSSRNQDWVMKIDYNNGVRSGGLGTGNILWRDSTGAPIGGGVISYQAGGHQRIAVAAGMNSIVWPVKQAMARIVIYALP